ncbi:hypothetical protein KFE25_012185 [Diacronema lutheri]|uniref:Feruloyl esterase n=2 Tax=Diacronema lutheri TaxID=2081491 RepID=A0A8J6CA88_DIALT|nr:hypothetical protein KFE25_012185 [Diacronema lutheri]
MWRLCAVLAWAACAAAINCERYPSNPHCRPPPSPPPSPTPPSTPPSPPPSWPPSSPPPLPPPLTRREAAARAAAARRSAHVPAGAVTARLAAGSSAAHACRGRHCPPPQLARPSPVATPMPVPSPSPPASPPAGAELGAAGEAVSAPESPPAPVRRDADPPAYAYERWSRAAPPCRTPAPAQPPAVGTTAHALVSQGRARRFLLHVPALYASHPHIASPLILEFPGSDDSAERQANRSRLAAASDRFGFLYATLEGVGRFLNVERDARAAASGPDDIAYVTDVLATIRARACVDNTRVYATGFSRGARMSSRLASELPAIVAAVGPVAGVRYPRPNNATRAVPIIAFHGLADPINPYDGGGPAYWRTGVPDAIGRWVAHNRCEPTPAQQPLSEHVTRVSYSGCADGADVALVLIANGGHRYPSGCLSLSRTLDRQFGFCSFEVETNELMFEFFMRHPMPAKTTALPALATSEHVRLHAERSLLRSAPEPRTVARPAALLCTILVGALAVSLVTRSRARRRNAVVRAPSDVPMQLMGSSGSRLADGYSAQAARECR